MNADPRLKQQVKTSFWHPHWLTPVGTTLAAIGLFCGLMLLTIFRPTLNHWLQHLTYGGLAGASNTPDRINGIRIITGFCAMMLVVGAVILGRARARYGALLAALDGAPGVVWIYRERARLPGGDEHVLVFGLRSGAKVRATLPTAEADQLWGLAVEAFPAASRGHDSQQERRFATRPGAGEPRVVAAIQLLDGRDRAR